MFPGIRNRIPLLAGSRASLASPSGKKANEVTRNYTRLGSSHSVAAEDSSLFGCDSVSFGKLFLTPERIAMA
jgi:hypothetical protein